MATASFKRFKDLINSIYLEYEFVSAVYCLEPWEKRIVNAVISLLSATIVYSTYKYLPHYTASLLNYIKESII